MSAPENKSTAQKQEIAYALNAAKEELQPIQFERPSLEATEVLVEVSHCGICRSDIHLLDGDWGEFGYPLVCGHEIVGFVKQIGSAVKSVKLNDRVGVGWVKKCCLECNDCTKGDEHLCDNNMNTCGSGTFGGFATVFQADESFLFPIPQELKSEDAAPLLCAGVTVYSPLVKYSKPGDRVGVVGIGGLGHLLIKFAQARKNDVVAFSRSKDKEEYAKKIGAKKFVDSTDAKEMRKLNHQLDLLVVTIDANIDYMPYVQLVKKNGTICFVGMAQDAVIPLPVSHLISYNIRVTGSATGSRKMMKEMLEFAAAHNVKPEVELFAFADINKAITKVRENKIRFRAVLTLEPKSVKM